MQQPCIPFITKTLTYLIDNALITSYNMGSIKKCKFTEKKACILS